MDLGCIKVLEWEGNLGGKFREGSKLAAILNAWCMTLVQDTHIFLDVDLPIFMVL